MQEEQQRKELGDFLRLHRTRTPPTAVGLQSTSKRRTPGLRREEVADLVGISVTWYAYLEQGRDISVSVGVLERLAEVFRLSHHERVHLFGLAGKWTMTSTTASEEHISSTLQRILDYHNPYPAYVLGQRWDIIGWNDAACAVLNDFTKLTLRERNLLAIMFTNSYIRQTLVNWEDHAQRVLRHFRIDYGQRSGDPILAELVERLLKESKEFTLWWNFPDVDAQANTPKEIQHPELGRLLFEQSAFLVLDNPALKLLLYTPLNKTTTRKLRHLQRANWTNGQLPAGQNGYLNGKEPDGS